MSSEASIEAVAVEKAVAVEEAVALAAAWKLLEELDYTHISLRTVGRGGRQFEMVVQIRGTEMPVSARGRTAAEAIEAVAVRATRKAGKK